MKFNQNTHLQNRNKVSANELKPFFGKYVAWSLDGKTIRLSAKEEKGLYISLRKNGIPTDQVVISYLPFPNEVMLGGVFMECTEVKH
jgi:hypothetical protein